MADILQADTRDVVSDSTIPWHRLQGSTILVTGATGLIGSALVRSLAAADREHHLNIQLIGHGRNGSKGRALGQGPNFTFIEGDIRQPLALPGTAEPIDYIFHCSAITKSAAMAAHPVDVMLTAADGTKNMLDLATERHCRGFVYLSSMEVYGQTQLHEVCEDDLGPLDMSSPRSSYPESKRYCEVLCTAYAAQYGTPVKMARLAQTFGAGTSPNDTRVFAQFARSAAAGKNIELHTEGRSRGNYCYIADAIRGLMVVLLLGKNGEAYNISNPDASVTIREMAKLVAGTIGKGKTNVVVNIPGDIQARGYAPDAGYVLNIDKLKALGWIPKYGLEDMYRRMLMHWNHS